MSSKSKKQPAKAAQKPQQVTQEAKKLTASQRIDNLENMVVVQERKFEILADEIDQLRKIIQSLGKRLSASIKAAEEGELNNDSVNKIIIQQAEKELENKLAQLVTAGVLEKVEDNTEAIGQKHFVVGRELNEDGTVINPRAQFAIASVDESLQAKVLGRKLGEIAPLQQGELKTNFEITELYRLVEVDQQKKFKQEDPALSGNENAKKSKK